MASRYPKAYSRMLTLLRAARLEAGLTQSEVAARLRVNQTWVSKVEIGERRLDPIELVRLAEIYGGAAVDFLPRRVR